MALDFHKDTLAVPGSTGSQGYTGVGFVPKSVLFFASHLTSNAFGAHQAGGIGLVGSTTAANQKSIGWASQDAVATTVTRRIYQGAHALYIVDHAGTVLARATLTSFDADGFTLNWLAVTSGIIVHYIALGGADITNAASGAFSVPATTTGDLPVTGVGFVPDLLFLISASTNGNDNTSGAAVALGCAQSPSAQWAALWSADFGDTMTPFSAKKGQRTDSCLWTPSVTGTTQIRLALTSMDADGFTVNRLQVTTGARTVGYLAIKGGSFAVGAVNKPTDAATASHDITAPGFPGKGVFLQANGQVSGTVVVADCEQSTGGSDFTTEGHIWSEGQDVAVGGVTESNAKSSATKALSINTGPSTVLAEADAASHASGFSLAWTTNDAIASELLYVLFGDTPSAAAPGPPPIRRRGPTRVWTRRRVA